MNNTFNTFSHINHMPLRVFNRTIMFNNILNDFGMDTAEEYIDHFNQGERKQMYIMQTYIKKFGYDKAKHEATKDLELEDVQHDEKTGLIPA